MNQIEGFSVPNIDALSDEDLVTLANVLGTLSDYCVECIVARDYRKAGEIDAAVRTEKYSEFIYSELPNWARW